MSIPIPSWGADIIERDDLRRENKQLKDDLAAINKIVSTNIERLKQERDSAVELLRSTIPIDSGLHDELQLLFDRIEATDKLI